MDNVPRAMKISTADVFMNKNKRPSKSTRQLEGAGTNPLETAGEEDTLMGRLAKRMAARDYIDKQNLGMGTKATKAATADAGIEFGKFKKGVREIADTSTYQSEYNTGKKIEAEHKDTVAKIKSGKIKTPEEAYGAIASDHMKEHPDYYNSKNGLPAMEKELASMEDNFLIKDKYDDMQSITPYWDKMERIRGKDLDASGINAQLRHKANATQGALGDDYSDPSKTEMVMPGATMVDQAKNTGRVIGKGLENLRQHL